MSCWTTSKDSNLWRLQTLFLVSLDPCCCLYSWQLIWDVESKFWIIWSVFVISLNPQHGCLCSPLIRLLNKFVILWIGLKFQGWEMLHANKREQTTYEWYNRGNRAQSKWQGSEQPTSRQQKTIEETFDLLCITQQADDVIVLQYKKILHG